MRTHYTKSNTLSFLLTTTIGLASLCGLSWLVFNTKGYFQEPASPVLPTFIQTTPAPVAIRAPQYIALEEGDTFEQIASYFGISPATVEAIMQIPQAAEALSVLHANAKLIIQFNQAQELIGLRYTITSRKILILTYQHAAWKASIVQKPQYHQLLAATLAAYFRADPLPAKVLLLLAVHVLQDSQRALTFINKSLVHLNLKEVCRIPSLNHAYLKISILAQAPEPAPVLTPPAAQASLQPQPPLQNLLYASSAQDKIDPQLYGQLQNIFKDIVRLEPNLRENERFNVIYDHQGQIQLAVVTVNHKTYEAIRYTNAQGYTGYYSPTGQALNKSEFLAAPVQYTRISDRFSLHRRHPILHLIRPHYGVDYAAATGTPIRAISSGYISFAGWGNGYGNIVIIHHDNHYQSLYAHMSHIGYLIRPGQWVEQGQIIGYVGSTGLTTGPHLHFGLYQYGRAINPAIILPQFNPPLHITQAELTDFFAKTNQLLTQLAWDQDHNIVL